MARPTRYYELQTNTGQRITATRPYDNETVKTGTRTLVMCREETGTYQQVWTVTDRTPSHPKSMGWTTYVIGINVTLPEVNGEIIQAVPTGTRPSDAPDYSTGPRAPSPPKPTPTPEATPEPVPIPRAPGEHESFGKLLSAVKAGMNVLLVGPAGSGKTTACKKAADALELPFDYVALGPTITESRIFGYMNAAGTYVPTGFRTVYENGGVFLFDEMDSGNPAVLVAINAAIENGVASFPDGLKHRHPDARFVASANTFGRGATAEYVGRNALDAATLDRFTARIEWTYDEALETSIGGNPEWTKTVQAHRAAVAEIGLKRHVISPRASINGSKLLAAGWKRADVEAAALYWGLDEATTQKLKTAARKRL